MIPVFAAAARFDSTKAEALEHGAFFCLRVVFFSAGAEMILEVVVVMIAQRGFLGRHAPVACIGVVPERAG